MVLIFSFFFTICENKFANQLRNSNNLLISVIAIYTDIDECESEIFRCPKDAVCNNTNGGYDCVCKPGYHKVNNGTENICAVKIGTNGLFVFIVILTNMPEL